MKEKNNKSQNEPIFAYFQKSLKKLENFLQEPIQTERDQAGVIQAFEFTFEQFWKCLQKISYFEGIEIASPRQALKIGIKLEFLDLKDEKLWLKMLEDRNLTSHTYREDYALRISQDIKDIHVKLFKKALEKIVAHHPQ